MTVAPIGPERPDRLELVIRFVCGGLFGVGFGAALVLLALEVETALAVIATIIGCAVLCGVLAMRFGDRFWYGLGNWLGWF